MPLGKPYASKNPRKYQAATTNTMVDMMMFQMDGRVNMA
jgi:hypothetical protein